MQDEEEKDLKYDFKYGANLKQVGDSIVYDDELNRLVKKKRKK